MRVIAVDPGYDRMGIAVMEHGGTKEKLIHSACITTEKGMGVPERLAELGDAFLQLLKEHAPDCVAIETLFFNKNQKTAMVVAEARGIILYLAHTHNCTVYEYGPQQVKTAVTGYGKSDKDQITDMVKRLVEGVPENALDDEYDAIAVGITCLASIR